MIIGFTGYQRAGKDTAADYFVKNFKFEKVGFADKFKEAFCVLTGLDRTELEILKNDRTAYLAIGYINNPSESPTDEDVSFAEESDGSVRMWSPVVDPITVRHALQRLGTEVGRQLFADNFWVTMLDEHIATMGFQNVVIPDVRFVNEVDYIHSVGGKIILVERDSATAQETHRSEIRLPNELIDYIINNSGSMRALEAQLEHLARKFKERIK